MMRARGDRSGALAAPQLDPTDATDQVRQHSLRKSMMHVAPSSPDLGERLKAGWNDSEKPKPIIGLVPIGADPGMQLRCSAEELAIQFIPIRLS
jgi:hypothetical protein